MLLKALILNARNARSLSRTSIIKNILLHAKVAFFAEKTHPRLLLRSIGLFASLQDLRKNALSAKKRF